MKIVLALAVLAGSAEAGSYGHGWWGHGHGHNRRWDYLAEGQSCSGCARGAGCFSAQCPDTTTCHIEDRTAYCMAQCKTSCGKIVQHGWEGAGEGANHCNTCYCEDGNLVCTEVACPALPCLAEGGDCTTRPTQCPTGTTCTANVCTATEESPCATHECTAPSTCKVSAANAAVCEYDCSGEQGEWTAAQRTWCCATLDVGCPECDAEGHYFAPCPSEEYMAFASLLKSGYAPDAPSSILMIRASMEGYNVFGTQIAEKYYEERFFGDVRTLVFGARRKTAASGRYLLEMHAGGYVGGHPDYLTLQQQQLSIATGATVIAIDYKLAPEYPLPYQTNEVVTVYQALLAEGIAPGMISMIGGSAGGGLVLLTLQKLRDMGVPLPSSSVLLSPWTDLALTGPSVTGNSATEFVVSETSLHYSSNGAVGNMNVNSEMVDNKDRSLPIYSPINGDFTGLPPLYFIAGAGEVLVDDTTRVVTKARAAGVSVKEWLPDNMFHVFPSMLQLFPEGMMAQGRIASFLDEHYTA